MKKHQKILLLIFLVTLFFRLYFAFQTPNYDYDAYFNIRQINEISATETPLFNDPLSFSGRLFVFTPIFHYILAFFNNFLPSLIVFKIIPNIFASSIVPIIYLIAKKITKNINHSLLTSFVSAFIPVFIAETTNRVSVYSLTVPLTFLAIYFFLDIKKHLNHFIILAILLPLIHSTSFFLIIGLLFYLLLVKLERLKQERTETELIFFSLFFTVWAQFLIFKNALLAHGPAVIWQNIPFAVLYASQTTIWQNILKVGIIPLICGIYVIYKGFFREKNKETYLLFGFALSAFLLLWFKLINPITGLIFLGMTLTLFFAQFYKLFFTAIKKTKVAKYKKQILFLFVLLFILTSVVPSFYFTNQKIKTTPSLQETNALLWLKQNTNQSHIVLGSLKQGHMITEVAQRKNVWDNNFLLIKDSNILYKDIETIFTTPYKTQSVALLNKYKVDYIFVSDQTKSEYNIDDISYIHDQECFKPIYDRNVKIYKSMCKIEEVWKR